MPETDKKPECIPNGKVETGALSKESTPPLKDEVKTPKASSPNKSEEGSPKTAGESKKVEAKAKAELPKETKPDDKPEAKPEAKPKNGARDKSIGPKATGKLKSSESTTKIAEPPAAFKEKFQLFSKFGDTKSDGKLITLSQSDKWMKQAKVVDGKKVTTTDTAIHFKKLKSVKVNLKDYNQFIEDLSKTKGVNADEIRDKLAACGAPAVSGTAGENKKIDATVNRLTDVSKYTGSHKQRFDETGKGKGLSGRKDIPDPSGYVQGYQNKNTYSKTH